MKHTLLLIEDDPILRLNVAVYFKDKGYEVLEAETGKQGLEIALKEKPEAILLDIMMPEMDGITMIKELSEKDKELIPRVTLMTSSESMQHLSKAIEYGVFRYILKSDMSLDKIFKVVEDNLGK